MSLRKKLVARSTTLFFFSLLIVVLGTYVLFQRSIEHAYNEKLLGIAILSGHFYLEKDELNEVTHKRIEEDFKKISSESIALYRTDRTVYIDDSLKFKLPDAILQQTTKEGKVFFKVEDRFYLSLFYRDNEGDFVIMVSGLNHSGQEQLKLLRHMLLLTGIIALVLHFLLSRLLANNTFRPFDKLIKQVRSIKGQDRHLRLDYTGRADDEIKSFTVEFNYLLDRLEASFEIQKNFLRNATHEIKTPLAIIIGDIEVALNGQRSPTEYEALLLSLKNNSLHLRSLIQSLITLSNLEVMTDNNDSSFRIDDVIWQIVEKKKIEYPKRKIEVKFDGDLEFDETLLTVSGNRDLHFIALNNIVDNALKYSPENEKVDIAINTFYERLMISIIDKGRGIPQQHVDDIFNMFYRVPESKHIPGHGIGLYLAKLIFTLNHVIVEVDSAINVGSSFHIKFPVKPS